MPAARARAAGAGRAVDGDRGRDPDRAGLPASLFGFGAVILLGWRTWRGGHGPATFAQGATPIQPVTRPTA
jgi:hypothetical protein